MTKPLPPGADEGVCKGCGKRIWWIQTTEGKRVPLDPVPPVYWFHWTPGQVCNKLENRDPQPEWERSTDQNVQAYVSHFATCPKASEFSGRSKAKETP